MGEHADNIRLCATFTKHFFDKNIHNTIDKELDRAYIYEEFERIMHKYTLQEEIYMKEKVILAYSGGLDTTAIIPWLKENYDYEVICCCIDVGQESELDGLEERAKLSGAEKLYIEHLTEEFVDDYIIPCVKASAVYEHKYLLGTSMARPLIAKKLVEIARKEGAVAICHGATGKGNDQGRFELGIKALAPDLKIIAPWRCNETWGMSSREEEIEYCKKQTTATAVTATSGTSATKDLSSRIPQTHPTTITFLYSA